MSGTESALRPKVLLLGEIENAHESWAKLAARAEILTPRATDRAGFLAECAAGAFDGAVAAYRTFGSAAVTGRVDAEVLAALPRSLGFVCHNGAGYDQVDVAACTAAGVRVSHTPGAVDDATADAAVFLMLGALRGFARGLATCRRGDWRGPDDQDQRHQPPLGRDPRGKLLGILGMGGIGRNLAAKAAALGMRVQYHNRSRLPGHVERDACAGARYVGLEELLRTSDVLSLNLPLNPSTHHAISHAEFAKMKHGVVLVNTARGAVVDEAALVAALQSGRVAAAGLDVYEHEPVVHPGLLASDDCLLLPHMGTYTVETQTAMEDLAIANVVAAIDEGRLLTNVPEQAHLQF